MRISPGSGIGARPELGSAVIAMVLAAIGILSLLCSGWLRVPLARAWAFIYGKRKGKGMSTKSVYSIRIPAGLRQLMNEMKEVNWQEEISRLVEELVKSKRKERLLAEAKELRGEMTVEVSAGELLREDRDAR